MRPLLLLLSAGLFVYGQGVSITGYTPAVAHVGDQVELKVDGPAGQVSKVWFTASDGSSIPGRAFSDQYNRVQVPPGAVSGPVRVEWRTFGQNAALAADFQVIVYPRLRVRSPRLQLAQGESVRMSAIPKEMPAFSLDQVQWRADAGQIDASGTYTAPSVSSPVFARIWACLESNIECGTTVVEILPFRLDPAPVSLDPGESLRLRAVRGGSELAATWVATTKNISVTADGVVTAGTGSFDGGHAVITVTTSAGTQAFDLQVRGNGAMANTAEYHDWLGADSIGPFGRLRYGVFQSLMAVNGDWIYTISNSLPNNYIGEWADSWIDVYRLDSNRNIAWVTSIEAPRQSRVGRFAVEENRLVVTDEWQPGGVTYTYDISAGAPVLLAREIVTAGQPSAWPREGFRCSLDPPTTSDGFQGRVSIIQENLAIGTRRTLPLGYQPVYDRFSSRAVCAEGWAAIVFHYPFSQSGSDYETILVDLAGERAEPFAEFPFGGLNFSMTILDGLLLLDRKVVEVRNREARILSDMPVGWVMAVDARRKWILAAPQASLLSDGIRVVDLSDPSRPRVSAPVAHPSQFAPNAALGSDFFVLGGGQQNIGVYPIRWEAGPALLSTFPASPSMNDVKVKDRFAFWTGPGVGTVVRTFARSYFQVYDLSQPPYQLVASLDRPVNEVGWAVELVGNYAFVGTDRSLVLYDIQSPRAPVERLVIPAPAYSLARLGNYLYAGSNTDREPQLMVYDITDPTRPKLVSTVPLPDFAYAITAQSGWLAVALGKRGLRSFSLVNPAQPVFANDTPGTYWGVAGAGNTLYTAADAAGLLVYAVSPTGLLSFIHRRELGKQGESASESYPYALAISYDERGIVWISTSMDGRVYGLDVREPRRSRPIAEFPTQFGAYAAQNSLVVGGVLYIAGNLAAYDVSVPQNVSGYDIRQSTPGAVLPDRFGQKPPYRTSDSEGSASVFEPAKAKSLRERNPIP